MAHFAFKGHCTTVLTTITSVGSVQDGLTLKLECSFGSIGSAGPSRKSEVLEQHEFLICYHYGKDHWHIE